MQNKKLLKFTYSKKHSQMEFCEKLNTILTGSPKLFKVENSQTMVSQLLIVVKIKNNPTS